MPLLGAAAMLLSFDVEPGAVAEHDQWHTQEHLPERLTIPGFLRGSRWVANGPGPRYLVLYEVRDLGTLGGEPYLARLNQPTPWTARMMTHYRGMTRGLCVVVGSTGLGLGGHAALIRFGVASGSDLDDWLEAQVLAKVPSMPGLGSAHYLRGAQAAAMTQEQRIRGVDRSIDSALVITGYDAAAVADCAAWLAGEQGMTAQGSSEVSCGCYTLGYSLSAVELDARE